MRKIYLSLVALLLSINASFTQTWDWGVAWDTVNINDIESWHGSMVVDPDNNVYVLGSFYVTNLHIGPQRLVNRGQYEIFLCSYDKDGTFRWATSVGSAGNDAIAGISLDASNNIYIGGAYRNNTVYFTPTNTLLNSGDYDSFIAKYSSDGTFQWAQKVFWGVKNQRIQDMEFDRDNNCFVVVGNFTDSLMYYNCTQNVKLTALGTKDQFVATLNATATAVTNIKNFKASDASTTSFKKVKPYIVGTTTYEYYIAGDLKNDIYLDPGYIYPVNDNILLTDRRMHS